MQYSFTIDDLWAYLATKQDEEVVGYCMDAYRCLIAEAVRAKYANWLGNGEVCVAMGAIGVAGVRLPLTRVLGDVQVAFDLWTPEGPHEPVTKAEFMQAWQSFQTESGKP